jgi:hypothetical protein
MKIVPIFADRLYAFHYEGESDNEYERLMSLWTDVAYLYNFARQNNVADVSAFVEDILDQTEALQDFLDNLEQKHTPYNLYFVPLDQAEWKTPNLPLQKGKISKNSLRLYAVKIDQDCFVITGGAIKMSQTMQDHPDTNQELGKMRTARSFLRQNGVFDEDSFFEFLSEEI